MRLRFISNSIVALIPAKAGGQFKIKEERGWIPVFTGMTLFLFLSLFSLQASAIQGAGNIEVYFSPNGGATDAIVREIDRSGQKVLVQAYSFTSRPIADALIKAHKRGVAVTVIMDGGQLREKYNAVRFLKNSGVQIYVDDNHAIAHNKVMIIDNRTLITGSFNFTKAAEHENAENLLILKDNPALLDRYTNDFLTHLNHSARK